MKNIIKFLFVPLMLCGCENFLDREPYDNLESDSYFNSAAEVNTGVLACYNGIHNTLDYEFFVTEVRSDNTRNYNQSPTNGVTLEFTHMDLGRVETSNSINTDYWETVYHNIANCNTVLQYLDKVEDPDLKVQYEAEARFIRAYHYFNLVRIYGPLFLVTERITPDEAKLYERTSESDIYDWIIEELKFCKDGLPEQYADEELGRVTSWAAKMLLAKVYLTLSDNGTDHTMLENARTLLKDIEQNSGYSLVTDAGSAASAYANVFSTNNEMNEEIIFAVRFLSGGHGTGSPFANYFAPASSEDAVIYGSGSGYNCPTEDLIEAYKSEEGDQRLDAVIKETYINKVGTEVYQQYAVKYFSTVTVRYDAENDWPVLRYADVLLMLGEIENELNGPTQKAWDYLNATRNRAGLDDIQPSSRAEYRDAMAKERRLEFALENQRWFDLLRTDRWIDVLENHFKTEQVRNTGSGSKSSYYGNSKYSSYVSNPRLEEWQRLLPIPYNVIITAPYATQNAGY